MSHIKTPSEPVSPKLNPAYLPPLPLYGGDSKEAEHPNPGWQVAPQPIQLQAHHLQQLHQLGEVLYRFVQAIDTLYRHSRNPNTDIPAWIADLYDQGKPDDLLRFSAMKRFRSHLPLVIRPDLLLNETGWTLCEIDAVPGGIGFTAAMNTAYRQSGLPVLEAPVGMPTAFLNMLLSFVRSRQPDCAQPCIAVVVSDEAQDYRAELQWLVDTIRQGDEKQAPYPSIALLHPRDLHLVRDRLVFKDTNTGQDRAIDVIYRFFELFDLPHIPQIELIQYAIKKGLVLCTPPFKPHLEEKLSLALLHHPRLQAFWRHALGEESLEQLHQWVPPGWIMDPTPLPPQAVIANLAPAGEVLQDFRELKTLSQKARQLVLKPSGFSPLGWGSRGVTIGHDHPLEVWQVRVDEALSQFGQTPYLLQPFVPATPQHVERMNLETGAIETFPARIRLCPYYFITGEQVVLAGALATACPQDKKLIHGMKDAVLAPVASGARSAV